MSATGGRWNMRQIDACLMLAEVATDEGLVDRFPMTARLTEELAELLQEVLTEADFDLCCDPASITDKTLYDRLQQMVKEAAEYPELGQPEQDPE